LSVVLTWSELEVAWEEVEPEAEEDLGGQWRRSLVAMCRRWLQLQLGRDNGI
jgi:hypothetical protein